MLFTHSTYSTAAIQVSILPEEFIVFLRLLHQRFLSGKSYKAVVTINSRRIGTVLQKKSPPLNLLVSLLFLFEDFAPSWVSVCR